MPDTPQITDATLHALADDAFEVMNWARRMGMKRDQQLSEVVKAFRLTLDKAGVGQAADTRPDPLGEALNSGDGVYRP